MRSGIWTAFLFGLSLLGTPAWAQNGGVKIGVLDDMSGPYADIQGPGDTLAVRMAVEDFGGNVLGAPVQVLEADHQNKADVGAGIARRWYDVDHVDAILGLGNSSVALAVQSVAREKRKVDIVTSGGTADLTGKDCSPFGIHWVFDSYALANGTASTVLRQGGDTWFFITADYAFGHALEHDASAVVTRLGGKVLGSVQAPLGTTDFSSQLLQAQASGAKVIGLANVGNDVINTMKQAAEFGITGNQRLAGLLVLLTDIHSVGLQVAQGLVFTEAYYWDQNDETRAFSQRFASRHGGKPPTMFQAGIYSAALHYLKAVKAAGTNDAATVIEQMRKIPVNDFMTHNGSIRADGRMMRDMYLLQAKTPEESKGEWDLLKVVATIPAEQAFRPLSETACPLLAR